MQMSFLRQILKGWGRAAIWEVGFPDAHSELRSLVVRSELGFPVVFLQFRFKGWSGGRPPAAKMRCSKSRHLKTNCSNI